MATTVKGERRTGESSEKQERERGRKLLPGNLFFTPAINGKLPQHLLAVKKPTTKTFSNSLLEQKNVFDLLTERGC